MNRHPSPRGQERGAALLTAMIIVTLIATLSAGMVWQQWRAIQVESAERARAQAAWILSGALDFAKLILSEDAKNRAGYTALTEPWATPLAESRLSTFLAVDKANADDGPEAFLSGDIVDAQARYNLGNLVLFVGNEPQVNPKELQVLVRLCEASSVETGTAGRIANQLRDALNRKIPNAPLTPRTVAQLAWLGIDQATIKALSPFVTLLPAPPTPGSNAVFSKNGVNVNTASTEVLAAVLGDSGTASRMVQIRQRTPFKTIDEFKTQAGINGTAGATSTEIDVKSSYFEVRGRLRLADRVLLENSLLYRAYPKFTVLERRRVASVEEAGG